MQYFEHHFCGNKEVCITYRGSTFKTKGSYVDSWSWYTNLKALFIFLHISCILHSTKIPKQEGNYNIVNVIVDSQSCLLI